MYIQNDIQKRKEKISNENKKQEFSYKNEGRRV